MCGFLEERTRGRVTTIASATIVSVVAIAVVAVAVITVSVVRVAVVAAGIAPSVASSIVTGTIIGGSATRIALTELVAYGRITLACGLTNIGNGGQRGQNDERQTQGIFNGRCTVFEPNNPC